jgi:hypothetical protein
MKISSHDAQKTNFLGMKLKSRLHRLLHYLASHLTIYFRQFRCWFAICATIARALPTRSKWDVYGFPGAVTFCLCAPREYCWRAAEADGASPSVCKQSLSLGHLPFANLVAEEVRKEPWLKLVPTLWCVRFNAGKLIARCWSNLGDFSYLRSLSQLCFLPPPAKQRRAWDNWKCKQSLNREIEKWKLFLFCP